MIKRNNKKGFTIVELVIVIAVIAILAAVLIPTFAGIIRKANISADTQLVKNMNTALAADEAINGKPDDFGKVLAIVREAGYIIASFNPTTEGCYVVWESETNQLLLVDGDDNYKVIYSAKDGYGDPDNSWYFAIEDKEAADKVTADLGANGVNVKMTATNTANLKDAVNVSGAHTIYVDESIEINSSSVLLIDKADADITLDFGSNKVSGSILGSPSIENVPFAVDSGKLTIKGGNINSVGETYDADGKLVKTFVAASNNATLVLDGVTFENAGSIETVVTTSNSVTTIKNSTIKVDNNAIGSFGASNVTVEDCVVDVNYLAFFSSNLNGASSITIDGGTYHSTVSNLLGVHGGTITVKDGTFKCDAAAKTLKFYDVAGGKIVIEGGTFNGVAFANLDEATLRGMCNLSDCASGVKITQENGAWVIAVNK